MGRHSAPEGRHRRAGSLLAQAGLVAVLALVAVSVLLGSNLARDTVDGTFAAAPESGPESTAPSAGVAVPGDGPSPSTVLSAPASRSAAPPTTDTPEPSADQVIPPESRGTDVTAAPTTPVTTTSTTPPAKFSDCADAKAAGVSVIPSSDPRYVRELDRDGDGVACDARGDSRATPSTTIVPTTTVTVEPAAAEDYPLQAEIVASVRRYAGKVPYRYGGKDPRRGLDCSGLVWQALKDAGMRVPYRTSGALRSWAVWVDERDAMPGDLAFYPGHVAVYVGGGRIVDAGSEATGIGERPMRTDKSWTFGRVPEGS